MPVKHLWVLIFCLLDIIQESIKEYFTSLIILYLQGDIDFPKIWLPDNIRLISVNAIAFLYNTSAWIHNDVFNTLAASLKLHSLLGKNKIIQQGLA